ncbi:MAG TPA: class I SAM-dependent methyltransferase [Candidatus Eisenbacteria bacterium]|nr:class I SAM-dependent methyltransferase [Candidatus Eisenbacteria bacterium]
MKVPDFSPLAERYATYRPGYPADLFEWLAETVKQRDTAWDSATGNGQAAWGLATHFHRVVGADVSGAQLRHARPHPRIDFVLARAEVSGLKGQSIDLVAVAAAIHWFDLPRFSEEVRRVIRPGGVLAAWTYHAAHVGPPLDNILWPFYRDVVGRYFAEGARSVDARYEGIELPGEGLKTPSFHASVSWNAEQVLNYVRTWSGVQSYIAATKQDPVSDLEKPIVAAMGGRDVTRLVTWPLYLRASRL